MCTGARDFGGANGAGAGAATAATWGAGLIAGAGRLATLPERCRMSDTSWSGEPLGSTVGSGVAAAAVAAGGGRVTAAGGAALRAGATSDRGGWLATAESCACARQV